MIWPFRKPAPLAFRVPEGTRIYAVGDIHGKADLLRCLQQTIARDAQGFAGDSIIEVYLGDYVDRGNASAEVLDLLLTDPPPRHERVCLRGNHEQALLDALEDTQALRGWLQFGGLSTLASYGVAIPSVVAEDAAAQMRDQLRRALPSAHLAFLQTLRTHFECGGYYFVHAGVRPGRSLAAQSDEDRLWIRDDFLRHQRAFAKYIVHGHSPNAAPELLAHRANLDVSDAPVPSLCILRLEGESRELLLVQEGIED